MMIFGVHKMWGIHKKYKGLSWFENFMGGHLSLGRLTIYGENAMNWSVNMKIKSAYLCFTLPTWRRMINKDEWYVYFSKDATPSRSKWYYGTKRKYKRILSKREILNKKLIKIKNIS